MKAKIIFQLVSSMLRRVRALAAEKGMPVPALSAQLGNLLDENSDHNRARKRALTRLRKGLELDWNPTSSRQDLHDRML